jgi:hypothetical protein
MSILKKDNIFFQIEDKNKIQPEYYEGIKEECSQKSSGYLALVYKNNEIRVLPIKHWILFHKNVKYMDEEEYNAKVKKAEEEFLKIQKGKKGKKFLMKKKAEEEEEEMAKAFEKQVPAEKNSESGSEKGKVALGVQKPKYGFLFHLNRKEKGKMMNYQLKKALWQAKRMKLNSLKNSQSIFFHSKTF